MIHALAETLAVKPSLDRSLDMIETYPVRMRWTKLYKMVLLCTLRCSLAFKMCLNILVFTMALVLRRIFME